MLTTKWLEANKSIAHSNCSICQGHLNWFKSVGQDHARHLGLAQENFRRHLEAKHPKIVLPTYEEDLQAYTEDIKED